MFKKILQNLKVYNNFDFDIYETMQLKSFQFYKDPSFCTFEDVKNVRKSFRRKSSSLQIILNVWDIDSQIVLC